MTVDERPDSVEEAGALLGAAITVCGIGTVPANQPPAGMHSSFATVNSVPSSELLTRLYYLRALLRASPPEAPLVAAPSLLAVLMKLLSTSTQLAAKHSPTMDPSRSRDEVPPMLSTPLRKLWVDCVVLCHRLGEGLSGAARTSLFSFLKNMIALAGMNPRSAKAGGGARIAALDVIAGLFQDETLASKVSGWAHDVLQLATRALRSSGNGEPSFRISAVKMSCAVAQACRDSQLKLKPVEGGPQRALLLPGAMEAPAVEQAVKILKQASADKFPEVRSACATFAAVMAPLLVLIPKKPKSNSSREENPNAPLLNLDEVISIAMKNIDDESAHAASSWAEALARCLCTAVEVGQRKADSALAKRDVEVDQDGPSSQTPGPTPQRNARRKEGPTAVCKNLRNAMLFLIKYFVKGGGELSAPRAGGTFSAGGRAVRVGLSNALVHLLKIQYTLGNIGVENSITLPEAVRVVLKMSGEEASKLFIVSPSTQTLDVTTPSTPEAKPAPGNALFGVKKSVADAGLVRLATANVLRFGISELASENTQLSLLQDYMELLNPDGPQSTDKSFLKCNPHQLQVVLVELSHLLIALGDASASKVEELSAHLQYYLSHEVHGVRHEAAVACGALATCFPAEGRKMVVSVLEHIEKEHKDLMGVANRGEISEVNDPKRSFPRMFRRAKKEPEKKPVDPSLVHQYAIHGKALMVAVVARDLPRVPGGISKGHLTAVLKVAELLVECQFNVVTSKANPSVACTCVRAGFGIITGILATGPVAAEPHTKKIFELFQKSYKSSSKGEGNFGIDHDLSCVEVVLASIVAFLSYCSELLLSVPEVLSEISIMLEELLVAFSRNGRFGKISTNPAALIRLHSAKASLMEAFAWLPSGSFPMAADSVFSFAGQQIRTAIAGEVTCSILPSLVTREDLLLDSKSLSRVDRTGQAGGAKPIEESIVVLVSEAANHGEREAVIHFPGSHASSVQANEFRNSQILGMFAFDAEQPPPTPLHAAVGTWRKPLDVSCSANVRLLDAAIQAFSATFGLKGGAEQQEAMEMLESLVPPFLTQLASAIGLNTTLTEPTSRTKAKEDNAAVANITAVLLSCLKALPLHEATHNVPIGLGPPWMNKAKDLLLTLLPSASNVVRRAAAEGLALLATLGVSEDAHFLQSAVLHSLDEVMQGNLPDGKPRALPLEPISASRAGSLLTLACIQRMAQKVSDTKSGRNKGRVLSAEEVILLAEETLPTLQMMTRILPSVARQGFRDFFIVQTHALHAFGLLLGYSGKLEKDKLDKEDLQLLRKGVELAEDNFVASWTVASADFDAGQEGEKLGAEVSFLAVLLRLMALLVPSLHHIHFENPGVAARFSCMATLILESTGSHPVVAVECMAFFELLSNNRHLLPPPSPKMANTDNPIISCIPFVKESLKPRYPGLFAVPEWLDMGGCLPSTRGSQAILRALKAMLVSSVFPEEDAQFVPALFAFLESCCAARCFGGATVHRPLAAPRAYELASTDGLAVEKEATDVLGALLAEHSGDDGTLLRWILFARSLSASASSVKSDIEHGVGAIAREADEEATLDASHVLEHVGQVRWQLKSLSVLLATGALDAMLRRCGSTGESPHFNYKAAEESIQQSQSSNPSSRLVLHLGSVISLACTSAVAAVDQAELPMVQLGAVIFLSKLVSCFRGVQDPQQAGMAILDQYATQIFSAVKHSLADEGELAEEGYYRRFYGGCETIQTIVESGLTKDPMAIKRIVRPTIPSAEETPFFQYGASCSKLANGVASDSDAKADFGNKRGLLLVRIGKVWTAGKLLSEEGKHDNIRKLVEDEASLAVYSAAIAFDGARLLLGAGTSLCGFVTVNGGEDENQPTMSNKRGFLYDNILDIDDSVKAAMVNTWSSCGFFALQTLIRSAASESDATKKEANLVWVKKLVPLMYKGLDDCLTGFANAAAKTASGWCGGVDSSEVAVNCLKGLRAFASNSSTHGQLSEVELDIDELLQRLREAVLLPALGHTIASSSDEQEKDSHEKKQAFLQLSESQQVAVATEICALILHSAGTPGKASSAVLLSILEPLDLLQRGQLDFAMIAVELILSTCLSAASVLISMSKTEDSFVKSMMLVAMDVQLSENSIPDSVNQAARNLLATCLSHTAVEAKDRRLVAQQLAKIGDWETWSAICSSDDGLAASGSSEGLKIVLLDTENPEQQLQALAAVRKLVQTQKSNLVGAVINEVGAEVLHFFKMYGTMPALSRSAQARRTAACAEAMKIVLVAFQQLVSDSAPENMFVAFLMVVFEYMLLVLRFNGLPNHPPPQTESDPALGRMAAQAIVHIARTAPAQFKVSLGSMADADRAVLEFAVRAEMTGYTSAAAAAAPKKKLSLKGFKK